MSSPIENLWSYNDWANKLVIKTMKSQKDVLPPHCLLLLSHIVNAQIIWLCRLNGQIPYLGVWDEHSLITCERYNNLASAGFGEKIKKYEDYGIHSIHYKNTKNDEFENSLEDILLHTFNHGTYHRAQIATEMRKNDLEPVSTDYIVFVRKQN